MFERLGGARALLSSRCKRLIWCFVALVTVASPLGGIIAATKPGETPGRRETTAPQGLSDLEPHFRRSVLRGWRVFQTSHARDGVACVHCHPDHDQIRQWAAAYPKVEVFDGTPYRVKSLAEVVGEAWRKHADQPPEDRIDDLVAYIAWWGDGTRITPGHSRRLPPPDKDLRLLKAAVAEGRKHYQRNDCGQCHQTGIRDRGSSSITVGKTAAGFPRFVPRADQVLDMGSYLQLHMRERGAETVSDPDRSVVELSAYLHSLAAGQTLQPGRNHQRREAGSTRSIE